MDHNEALRVHAVEKYVLGELPPPLRDKFEGHFFDCQECALDVTATAEFVDNARAVVPPGCAMLSAVFGRLAEIIVPASPSRTTQPSNCRFMFFLLFDLTGGCVGTAPARRCPKRGLLA